MGGDGGGERREGRVMRLRGRGRRGGQSASLGETMARLMIGRIGTAYGSSVLAIASKNRSLIVFCRSLFGASSSLFLHLGNYGARALKSRAPLVVVSGNGRLAAKFPVKFPVRRELPPETGAISTASPANQSGLSIFLGTTREKARQYGAFREPFSL